MRRTSLAFTWVGPFLVASLGALCACGSDTSGGAGPDSGHGGDGSTGDSSSSSGGSGDDGGSDGSTGGSSSGGGSSSSGGTPFVCRGCLDLGAHCQLGTADTMCGKTAANAPGTVSCTDCTGLSATPVCGPDGECVAGSSGAPPVDSGADDSQGSVDAPGG